MAAFWNYLSSNFDTLAEHAWGHFYVVALGLTLSSIIGISLGMLSYRNPTARAASLNTSAIILTIPSLALFAIMLTLPPPIGGLGARPVIAGLALYGLLPIVRNTIVGLNEVDQAIVESALGMGMGRRERLFRIEAPLAWPVIVTGIRVSGLLMVAIATIGSIVNGPGFGQMLLSALARIGSATATPQALVGTLGVIVFGICLDGLFRLLVHYTTPRGIRG
ncbi:MAG: ABC transporter permease [Actinobacteria bacterium]|nr:ABC transporter permease [Actinomycetota bacterium]